MRIKIKSTRYFLGLMIILVFSVSYAFAPVDSTGVGQSIQPDNQIPLGVLLLKTFVSLALVIALLIVFVMGLKWLQNKTQSGYHKVHSMSLYETLTLGPKKQLHLVKVLDHVILVGSSENTISLLLEMSEEDKEKLADKKIKQRPFSKSLADQLAKISGATKN